MKKIYLSVLTLTAAFAVNAQTPVYLQNFESDFNGETIVGSGAVETDANTSFNKVYHNNNDNNETRRANYLLLPATVMSDATKDSTYALSIGMWVQIGSGTIEAAGNYWSNLFAAYGAAPDPTTGNTWPMFVLEARGWCQLNNAGWTDFKAEENVAGANTESMDWLADGEWHYYTMTITPVTAIVYVDGAVVNQWNFTGLDGSYSRGLFTNGIDLDYVCLGGNQAWTWNDMDTAFKYDDLAIYSSALTSEQIQSIITAKTAVGITDKNVKTNGKLIGVEYFSISGARAGSDFYQLPKGAYIKSAVYSDGSRMNEKVVKMQ
jgi:hypothetical protein